MQMKNLILVKNWVKPISRALLLMLVFLVTFAGGGGGGSNGGKSGGGGKTSGGGKSPTCPSYSNKKSLRVHLGNFQYLPNTILTAPQFTCGQNGPNFGATPHRFRASLTSGVPTIPASSLLTYTTTDEDYVCEIAVVSTITCESTSDVTYWYWNSGENYEDIEIYSDMPCVIHVRYWDRMNMFPCSGNLNNARGVWTAQYDNGGTIINDAQITITPQLTAFAQ